MRENEVIEKLSRYRELDAKSREIAHEYDALLPSGVHAIEWRSPSSNTVYEPERYAAMRMDLSIKYDKAVRDAARARQIMTKLLESADKEDLGILFDRYYYGKDWTQIGTEYGIHRTSITRRHDKAIRKIASRVEGV